MNREKETTIKSIFNETPMSRETILQIASAENGVKEAPASSNKTKYGEWYSMNGVPWCAIFVSWVYHHAGRPLGKVDSPKGYHYCPSAYNFWKASNKLTDKPKAGDIILFDWNGDGKCDHTGIFIKWVEEGKTFMAWEGNTSFGNDSDGGIVMQRTRNKSTVKAFVNPGVFDDSVDVAPLHMKKGDAGAEVSRIQKVLYDLEYDIVVDGSFGAKTEKAVKQFQKDHSLEATGIVDAITEGAMEHALTKPNVTDAKIQTGAYLKKGDNGAVVIALQKALNKNGAKPAVIEDGVFGNGTFEALKKFQKAKGLTADGIAGPATLTALKLNKI
jgi:peptidoglycan hydrolase-like protein with peptidoglycan-binding domain